MKTKVPSTLGFAPDADPGMAIGSLSKRGVLFWGNVEIGTNTIFFLFLLPLHNLKGTSTMRQLSISSKSHRFGCS